MTKRDFALAVKAVIIRGEQALLLRRSKRELETSRVNRREAWDLPGGGIRFFETAEKGLIREIQEETGLQVNIIKPLGLYDAIKNQLHLSIFTYLCEYSAGEVVLSEEHESFYWQTLSELRAMPIPKWMLRDYEDAFSYYERWIE